MATYEDMSTRATLEELLRRIGEGDPEAVAALYAEEVDWQLDWPADEHGGAIPWIRYRSVRAEVAEHFREIAVGHVPELASVEVTKILVDGADAVVMGTIVNTARSTGKGYRARFALHVTVENGLVTRHHVYEDSLSVARAFAD
ncbi:nuclear transport factor 2 family protein [Streptosporangium sp. NPDC006013]|uniref:nuclear transport factor 2 family protein n=1 Tax=Streptosporangium sp. NPDC006013 TaxID=3155596 RepID=UPI0033BE5675